MVRFKLKKFIKIALDSILILSIVLFFIILSIKITINFKTLYYLDINNLNITHISKLNKNEIKLNYNYIINYITTNNYTNFKLPSFPSSKQGIIHFNEVKNIFSKLNTLLYICLLICLIGIYIKIKNKNFKFLFLSSLILLLLPLIILTFITINFNTYFTIFHKLIFNNNFWLFDSNTDPVILILPQKFFFHCSLLILLLILINSLILKLFYTYFVKNKY